MASPQAIEILKQIYNNPSDFIVPPKTIKEIETFYRQHMKTTPDMIQAMRQNAKIGLYIDKLLSGKAEILKQFKIKKGLQQGIMMECLVAQTLSKLFNLPLFEDVESNAPSNDLMDIITKNKLENTLKKARYVYYDKVTEMLIFQCGNPNTNDTNIFLHNATVNAEVKDIPALIVDADLLYDNDGKLIVSKKLQNKAQSCVKIIDYFNEKTDIISHAGSNFPIDTDDLKDVCQTMFKEYIQKIESEILFIPCENELIAILTEDLTKCLKNGEPIISLKGSEIRITGKNDRKPFANKLINDAIEKCCKPSAGDGICRISKSNTDIIGFVNGKGKNEFTRLKLTNHVFVRVKDVTETNDEYLFYKSKLRQSKCGMTVHLDCFHTKEEMKEYYRDIIGTNNCTN